VPGTADKEDKRRQGIKSYNLANLTKVSLPFAIELSRAAAD
jgi:hypothetical protein